MKEFLFLVFLLGLLSAPSFVLEDPEPPPEEQSYEIHFDVAPLAADIIMKETKEQLVYYPPDKLTSNCQLMNVDVGKSCLKHQDTTIKEEFFNKKVLDWPLSYGLSHIRNFGTEFIIG